jgi:hypothetical protein
MANYEVIVLGVQGINNKVFGPGERVTDKHFPEGNAAILCKDGKLKDLGATASEAKQKQIAKKEAEKILKKAVEVLEVAKDKLEKASETDREEAEKIFDEAELAFEVAKENFDKA